MFGSGSTVHVVVLFTEHCSRHCSQNTVHTPRVND
ncbi:hypothetical protein SLEP1_g49586 [Rubroshorea leprosula]|uniref:Uncharacterized protein n=1 Tax=Rubroshorea leprosula TaxID=152421 RepID=A0AAV5LYK4_9ROSI|nr:hypothetical protein SLEP1_g49586 [Rubroshorea leprosula]